MCEHREDQIGKVKFSDQAAPAWNKCETFAILPCHVAQDDQTFGASRLHLETGNGLLEEQQHISLRSKELRIYIQGVAQLADRWFLLSQASDRVSLFDHFGKIAFSKILYRYVASVQTRM